MKFFSAAALLAAIASTANALLVNTPTNAVQCQPLLITWDPQGSAGPFFLSVHPGDNPTGPALVSWEGLTGTSFTWTVDIAAGTNLGLLLRDSTGASSQSALFTVQAGSTTNCPASSNSVSLPPGTSLSSTPASSISSIPGSPTSTPLTPVSTSTRPPSSVSTPTSVRSSTTSSPASTATGGSSSGGALSNAVNFGSAGFLAALVGAVLA